MSAVLKEQIPILPLNTGVSHHWDWITIESIKVEFLYVLTKEQYLNLKMAQAQCEHHSLKRLKRQPVSL